MTADHSPRALLRLGARNFSWNLLGVVIPTLVALVCLPVIASRLGVERLGALGLIWAIVGYFGLFDLGMARVITRHLAAAPDAGDRARVLAWTRDLSIVLGVAMALLAVVAALVVWRLDVADSPVGGLDGAETALTIWIVLATLPAVAVTGVLRGVLEGQQRFGVSNALRIVLAAWSFAAPLLTSLWSTGLPLAAAAIAIGRYAGWFLHAKAAALPARGSETVRTPWRMLLGEGGWVTVSGIVGPVMVSMDRFVVASIISLAAASHYVVPQEVVLRLVAVPAALATALFPLIAGGWATGGVSDFVWQRGLRATLALAVPMCAVLAAFAEPLLRVWMGANFAAESAAVAAMMSVGLLFNCVAQVPFAVIQAAGRADLAGKIHCAELLPFVALLAWATDRWGIVGAAAVWSARAAVDWALMWWACTSVRRMTGARRELPLQAAAGIVIAALASAATASPAGPSRWLLAASLATAIVIAAIAARMALRESD